MQKKIHYQNYCFHKILFIFLLFFNLAACSTLYPNNKVASAYTVAFETLRGFVFGYPGQEISKELVESIPYASLKMRIGKGSDGLLILESLQAEETIWVSADQIVIVLKEGRIIRTLGLNNNLINLSVIDQSFKDVIFSEEFISNYFSYYSYDDPPLNDLKVNVSIEKIGIKEVDILGVKKSLFLIHESISNKEIRRYATNKYWIDPKNYYVWKSEQTLSPKLPKFFYEITKKPALK